MSYRSNKKINKLFELFDPSELQKAFFESTLSDSHTLYKDIFDKLSYQEKVQSLEQVNLNIQKSQAIYFLLIMKGLLAVSIFNSLLKEDLSSITEEDVEANIDFQNRLREKIESLDKKLKYKYKYLDELKKLEDVFDYWLTSFYKVRKGKHS